MDIVSFLSGVVATLFVELVLLILAFGGDEKSLKRKGRRKK
jgi:hypothetical protein